MDTHARFCGRFDSMKKPPTSLERSTEFQTGAHAHSSGRLESSTRSIERTERKRTFKKKLAPVRAIVSSMHMCRYVISENDGVPCGRLRPYEQSFCVPTTPISLGKKVFCPHSIFSSSSSKPLQTLAKLRSISLLI